MVRGNVAGVNPATLRHEVNAIRETPITTYRVMGTLKASFDAINDYSNTTANSVYSGGGLIHERTVELYDTMIFKVSYSAGYLKLNHGEYKTKITKKRMNEALNAADMSYRVVQRDFEWYVVDTRDGQTVAEFHDNTATLWL
jgi:hypothetical protein